MPRTYYSDVKPGTKKAKIVEKMMSPEGATTGWAQRHLNVPQTYFGALLSQQLTEFHGYDVRAFKNPNTYGSRIGARIYRIVGRWTWDGKYESYIDPADYLDQDGRVSA